MRYEVHLTREDGWWMVAIPALNGVTQARRREDVEREAMDYIVVTEDVAPSQVDIDITSVMVDGVQYYSRLDEERRDREQAEALASRAREQQARIAVNLNAGGVSMRDIATMLDLSHQRVHQLIATATSQVHAAA